MIKIDEFFNSEKYYNIENDEIKKFKLALINVVNSTVDNKEHFGRRSFHVVFCLFRSPLSRRTKVQFATNLFTS